MLIHSGIHTLFDIFFKSINSHCYYRNRLSVISFKISDDLCRLNSIHNDWVVQPIYKMNGQTDTSVWSESLERYIVPFVMWSNYDMNEEAVLEAVNYVSSEKGMLSMNYLSTLLMEAAGLPKSAYQLYMQDLIGKYPIIAANGFYDVDGNFYDTTNLSDMPKDLQAYWMLFRITFHFLAIAFTLVIFWIIQSKTTASYKVSSLSTLPREVVLLTIPRSVMTIHANHSASPLHGSGNGIHALSHLIQYSSESPL